MPLINVKVIENVFTDEQKGQIAERLTDAMVTIEGENMRGVTWVVIEEVKSGDWGIGGQTLTTEAVQALAAGKNPDPFCPQLVRADAGRACEVRPAAPLPSPGPIWNPVRG